MCVVAQACAGAGGWTALGLGLGSGPDLMVPFTVTSSIMSCTPFSAAARVALTGAAAHRHLSFLGGAIARVAVLDAVVTLHSDHCAIPLCGNTAFSVLLEDAALHMHLATCVVKPATTHAMAATETCGPVLEHHFPTAFRYEP